MHTLDNRSKKFDENQRFETRKISMMQSRDHVLQL